MTALCLSLSLSLSLFSFIISSYIDTRCGVYRTTRAYFFDSESFFKKKIPPKKKRRRERLALVLDFVFGGS